MMRLHKGFITHTIGDEQVMVAAGPAAKLFHGMVQPNAFREERNAYRNAL